MYDDCRANLLGGHQFGRPLLIVGELHGIALRLQHARNSGAELNLARYNQNASLATIHGGACYIFVTGGATLGHTLKYHSLLGFIAFASTPTVCSSPGKGHQAAD